MLKRSLTLISLLFCLNQIMLAQTKNKVEIVFAQNFEGIKTKSGTISKLIGLVQLKQGTTLMWCDSALLFDEQNEVEAYSNVRINHNDSVVITGDYLKYLGNDKRAFITGNVVLSDKNIVLTTDQLEYNIANSQAYYNNTAKIVSSENTLTSVFGYYYTQRKEFFFKRKVLLTNPKYVMDCDTLLYNTVTKTAFFYGPTTITGVSDKIICENGWYDTRLDLSQFSKNAILYSEGVKLNADSLHYNKKLKLGKAFRNIVLYDSAQKVYLYGNFGITNGLTKTSYVTKKASAIKLLQSNDSMFLWADTLMLLENTFKQKQMLKAYKNVKVFKADIQAVCDSLVYVDLDSSLFMFKQPIMWNGASQITSDTIVFYLKNNQLDSFRLLNNAFVSSKEKGAHYNQVKGKDMNGRMDSSGIKLINVFGNGQSIYYAKEDSINYTGVNVIDCSEMVFYFLKGNISKAVFITNADATLYPLDEQKPEDLRLKGFKWQEGKRPKR